MSSVQQPVILVIDSDPISLLGLAATLHSEKFEVHCAQDRAAAIQAARSQSLDLILCDVDLDGASGVDVVLEINNLPDRSDVPAMFISGNQMADVVSRRFRNGSALFLRRPFPPKLLIDLVDKALWMPHLVKSHINRPHIPLGRNEGAASAAGLSVPHAEIRR